jgi:hypothetical protein
MKLNLATERSWTGWKRSALSARLRAVSFMTSFSHFRHKWPWQQFVRVRFLDNRREVLPSKASNILSAETKLLSNQVFHPLDSTRNCGWWIGVAMIAFYENAFRRNRGAKL